MTALATDDPIAQLEEKSKRMRLSKESSEAVEIGMSSFVMGKDATHAFFASVAVKLKLTEDWSVPTGSVAENPDKNKGWLLKYNPEFVSKQSLAKTKGFVAHEVMHVVMKHMIRLADRPNHKKANIAADLEANQILRTAGFTLPDGGMFPETMDPPLPPDLACEEYYDLLPDDPEGGGDDEPGAGQGQEDPGGCGSFEVPGDGSASALDEAGAKIDQMVAAARDLAKGKGNLPGGIDRLVEKILHPKPDPWVILEQFVNRRARSEYRMNPPNRRYLAAGIILPSLRGEDLGELVVFVDLSGSVGDDMKVKMAEHMEGILEIYDCKLWIVYHDHKVQNVQTWEPGDGPLVMRGKGGGGTSHIPAFDWIKEQGMDPTCVVALTDMESSFPSREPDYPVIWASTLKGKKAPFGTLIEVD